MKQLLLLLSLFISSISVFGQQQKVVTFDFTSPSSLNLPTDDDSEITSETFTIGKVKMSFSKGSILVGVRYIKQNDNYYLKIANSSKIYLTTQEGATLNSVQVNTYTFGDLSIDNSQTGTWNDEMGLWNCGSSSTQSVAFKNSGSPSLIKSITVTYTEPTETLLPSPYQSSQTVSAFSSLSMNFGSKMTKIGTQSISMTSGTQAYPLTVNVNNAVVTLNAAEPITKDGTYTIFIPAGYFRNDAGYTNKALTYTITVSTPKNTLNYSSVSPGTGETDKLDSPITLTYGENLKSFSANLMMYKDGEEFCPVTIARSASNGKEVQLSFDIPEGITEKAIYTISVPEGTIYNLLSKVYNPAFTLTYKVGYTPAPVYSETMKKAIALNAKTGVGYPTADSESRQALNALVTAENTPSDEDLQTAIDAFYKESNVEKPTIGKWYYVANMGTNNVPLYLAVKGNSLQVTAKKSEATAFLIAEPMLLKTKDGKYAFTASVEDNTENKKLKVSKLSVSNVAAEKLFGYFSIFGYYETTKAGDVLEAYASVDRTKNEFSTDDHDAQAVFNDNYSGAFVFTETTEPSDEATEVEMHCVVSPSTVTDETGKLTLTFSDSNVINIADDAEATLCTEAGTTIQSLSLLANPKQTDVAIVIAGNLQDGKYKIVIPKGCLSYEINGVQYTNKELSVSFEVKKGSVNPDPTPSDFNKTYTGFLYYPVADYIKDVDLNSFTIGNSNYNYPSKPQGFEVDETKTVVLKQMDTVREIRRGHFERVASIPTDPDCPDAYQIVFDTPISEGELSADTYTFIIEEATFGDANFGKYLADHTSVKSSLCYVNPYTEFPFVVNNDKATGIKDITKDSDKPTVIYDLMGRRVQDMSRPGIYIVNGKKVVKK